MILHLSVNRREFLKQSTAGLASLGILAATPFNLAAADAVGSQPAAVPDKLVVLTFDDAVKSHLAFVAPLLKELGFGATFIFLYMLFTRFFPIVSIWEVREGRERAVPEVVERVRSYLPGKTAAITAED